MDINELVNELEYVTSIAKYHTDESKSILRKYLRKSDYIIQSYPMPKGYIIGTEKEILDIYKSLGLESPYTSNVGKDDVQKYIWCLNSHRRKNLKSIRYEIILSPISKY